MCSPAFMFLRESSDPLVDCPSITRIEGRCHQCGYHNAWPSMNLSPSNIRFYEKEIEYWRGSCEQLRNLIAEARRHIAMAGNSRDPFMEAWERRLNEILRKIHDDDVQRWRNAT